MTLGRMIHFFLPEQKLVGISARRFGVLFVCLDIFAFIVQAAGAIIASIQDGGSIVMTGLHIYMGGIGLQEVFIICFIALAIYLHRKLIKMGGSEDDCEGRLSQGPFSWRWLFYALYFALGMITVSRSAPAHEEKEWIDLLLTMLPCRCELFSESASMPKAHQPRTKSLHTRCMNTCLMLCLCSSLSSL